MRIPKLNSRPIFSAAMGVIVFAHFGSRDVLADEFTPSPNAPDVSVWDGSAGTTVNVEGSNATITVHMDLCCNLPASLAAYGRPDANDIAWQNSVLASIKGAQDMWNEALAKYPAKDCLHINVVFDAKWVDDGHWDNGYHRIMVSSGPVRSGSQDPMSKDARDDTMTVYGQSVGGEFSHDDTTNTYAHEIGHLMGLGDDYTQRKGLIRFLGGDNPSASTYPSAAIHGRCGTLMADSRNGKIDQQLADRLADIIGKTTELRCWKGKINASLAYMSATLNFSFTEKPDKQLFGSVLSGNGTGRVDLAGVFYKDVCSYTRTYTPVDLPIGVAGSRMAKDLELQLKLPPVQFEVTGRCPEKAVGVAHPTMDPKWYGLALLRAKLQEGTQPIAAGWKGTIELKCATCKAGTDRPWPPAAGQSATGVMEKCTEDPSAK
jgi:hypothetical protein